MVYDRGRISCTCEEGEHGPQRTQLNHYCNNDIARLDIDVLARICTVLGCGIGDLLEFVPEGEEPDPREKQ